MDYTSWSLATITDHTCNVWPAEAAAPGLGWQGGEGSCLERPEKSSLPWT